MANPVLPEPWHNFHSDALRREARIAGAVLLFIGLVVRFGPCAAPIPPHLRSALCPPSMGEARRHLPLF